MKLDRGTSEDDLIGQSERVYEKVCLALRGYTFRNNYRKKVKKAMAYTAKACLCQTSSSHSKGSSITMIRRLSLNSMYWHDSSKKISLNSNTCQRFKHAPEAGSPWKSNGLLWLYFIRNAIHKSTCNETNCFCRKVPAIPSVAWRCNYKTHGLHGIRKEEQHPSVQRKRMAPLPLLYRPLVPRTESCSRQRKNTDVRYNTNRECCWQRPMERRVGAE